MTLGIMSVAAAIASPNVADFLRSYEMRSASRQLYGELQRARTMAVMRNTRARLQLTDAGNLVVELYDADADQWTVESTHAEWSQSTRSLAVGGNATFEFESDGSASSSGPLWVKAKDGRILYVHTSPAGEIRVR